MPAKGRDRRKRLSAFMPRSLGPWRGTFARREERQMNKLTRATELSVPKVTTGALPASTKVYSAPENHADVRVPFREIALSAGEPPFRVYDPSGPYTDAAAEIDVARGLPRMRAAWIRQRGGVEPY
jgi:phosphomethylpyrimidine synthase